MESGGHQLIPRAKIGTKKGRQKKSVAQWEFSRVLSGVFRVFAKTLGKTLGKTAMFQSFSRVFHGTMSVIEV